MDEELDFKTEIKKYGLKIIYYNVLSDIYKDFIKNLVKDKNFKIRRLLNKINNLEKINKNIMKNEKIEDINHLHEENNFLKKKLEEYENIIKNKKEECINKDISINQIKTEIKELEKSNIEYKKEINYLNDEIYIYKKEITNLKDKLCLTGYKTKPCIFYIKGYCKNKTDCIFSHDMNHRNIRY